MINRNLKQYDAVNKKRRPNYCYSASLDTISIKNLPVDHSVFLTASSCYVYTNFRPGSELDPIQCEQCSGKSNRTGPVWS